MKTKSSLNEARVDILGNSMGNDSAKAVYPKHFLRKIEEKKALEKRTGHEFKQFVLSVESVKVCKPSATERLIRPKTIFSFT